MSKKRTNPHKNFMVFNAVLFFAVLAITAIFLYLSYTLKRDADRKVTYKGTYQIEISTDFYGQDLSIYINDSLLTNGIMPNTLTTFHIDRFAEEHILMVVDKQTDMTTPFNLNKEGSKVTIKKEEGEIIMEETPARF